MCITRTCYAYFQIYDIFWLTALDPRFKSLKVVENKEARDSIFKKLEKYLKEKEVEKNPENWPPNGQGPQVQRGHATAVGPAPAPVKEESVADSVDGDEEENDDASLVQHDLTHDGHGCNGQGGRHAGPVPEERDVARLGPD